MKTCPICGCHNADPAVVCSVCGVRFEARPAAPEAFSPAVPPQPPVSAIPPVSVVPPVSEEPPVDPLRAKANRMAIAGFVLSIMGFVTCLTTPLQLAALILSLSARNAKERSVFRTLGIVFSGIALACSVLLWFLLFLNSETFLENLWESYNITY